MTQALRYILGAPLLAAGWVLVGIGMVGECFLQFTWGLGTSLVDWGCECWGLEKRRWRDG